MYSKRKKTPKKSQIDPWDAWDSCEPQPAVEEVIIEDIPEAADPSSEIAAQLRQFSPYTKAPVALHIGEEPTVYYVPSHLLPCGKIRPYEDPVYLPNVEVDTGHSLVHYLYTGTYETLQASCGLEQALLAYIMAKNYDIPKLAKLTMAEMKSLCVELDIFQVMTSIEPNFTKLDFDIHDEGPVHAILRTKAKSTFEADYTAFESDEFLVRLGNADFRSFMLKCVMKLYSEKVSQMEKDRKDIKEKLGESEQAVKKYEAIWRADVEQSIASQDDHIAADADEVGFTGREDTEVVAPEPESISTDGFRDISYPSREDPIEPLRSFAGLEEPQPDITQSEVPFEDVYPEYPRPEAYPENSSPPAVYPEKEEPLAHGNAAETAQDELTKILEQMGGEIEDKES